MFGFISHAFHAVTHAVSHAFHAVTHFVAHHWKQILVIGAAVAVGVLVTIATGGLGAPLLLAAGAGGLAAGATSYTLNWLLASHRPGWSWKGFAEATVVSGVLAVGTAGLGELLSPVAGSVAGALVPDAVAAAIPDAVSSAVSNAAAGSALGAGTQVALNAVTGKPLGQGVGLAAIVGGGTGAVVGPIVEGIVPRPVVEEPVVAGGGPSPTIGIVNALDGIDKLPEPDLPPKFANAQWKSPEGELFGNGVIAASVHQGQLADCYLIASLASVADDQPGLIQNIIRLTPDGHYEVDLTNPRTGETTTTSLSSALPHSGNSTVFARAGTGDTQTALWPAMLEKGYALANGGYDAIGKGGWPSEPLSQITGKPAEWFWTNGSTPDQVWSSLTASDQNDWPTVVSTPETSVDSLVKGNHSYTFLGTKTAADGERLVVLRNPWGHDPTPDGVFTMPLDRFVKAFTRVDYVKVHAPPAS